MAVKVGSANGDEYNNAAGGRSGDQTGGEVGTQNWYVHPKGWRGMRAKSDAVAEKIASAMEKACANDLIGYDQSQRLTLYNKAKKVGFDPSKVTEACETDCSALVRVCLAYAGIMVGDFYTGDEYETIMATGKFTEIPASQLTSASFAKRGDVLVTRGVGHTVICLGTGSKVKTTSKTGTKTTTNTTAKKLNKEPKRTGHIVNCGMLNVRQWAGKQYEPCSFSPLPVGTIVSICDELKDDQGKTWYYINFMGRYGFVSSGDGKQAFIE